MSAHRIKIIIIFILCVCLSGQSSYGILSRSDLKIKMTMMFYVEMVFISSAPLSLVLLLLKLNLRLLLAIPRWWTRRIVSRLTEVCSEKMYEMCGTADCHSEQLELCSPDHVDEVCRIRQTKDCSGGACVTVDGEICRLVPQPHSACHELISKSCKVKHTGCDWMIVPQCGRVPHKKCSIKKVPKWMCSLSEDNNVLSALGATSAIVGSTITSHFQGLMGFQDEDGPEEVGDITVAPRNRRSVEPEEEIDASHYNLGPEVEQLVKVEDLMADARRWRSRRESELVEQVSRRSAKRRRSPEPVLGSVKRRRSPEPVPLPEMKRSSPEPVPEPVKRRRSPEPVPEPVKRRRSPETSGTKISPESLIKPVSVQGEIFPVHGKRSAEPAPEPN